MRVIERSAPLFRRLAQIEQIERETLRLAEAATKSQQAQFEQHVRQQTTRLQAAVTALMEEDEEDALALLLSA
jgi:hypothetical protein